MECGYVSMIMLYFSWVRILIIGFISIWNQDLNHNKATCLPINQQNKFFTNL